MRFRSKPSEIEAIQWTGENPNQVMDFMHTTLPEGDVQFTPPDGLYLRAGKDGAQGMVPVPVGHWIVRQPGDLTDHWPVDPDYFESKYEPVNKRTVMTVDNHPMNINRKDEA